jgi:peroxiredoxin (alkyl hydroperoxide reductase subunit C)
VIPPPNTQEGAEERLKEGLKEGYECVDWYLCQKKLK